MKTTFHQLAVLGLAAVCMTGCSSMKYKPQGMTEKQANAKVNTLEYECQWLHQGTYINISFYPDVASVANKEYSGNRNGYFYACNKMNGTISMSPTPLTMFDRGQVYPLKYVEAISKAPEPTQTAMADDMLDNIVKKVFQVKHDDPERSLLTQ